MAIHRLFRTPGPAGDEKKDSKKESNPRKEDYTPQAKAFWEHHTYHG